jgi:hypothetical protein
VPKYVVYFTTQSDNCVIIEADDEAEAYEVWQDEAFWNSEPKMLCKIVMDGIDVEELN